MIDALRRGVWIALVIGALLPVIGCATWQRTARESARVAHVATAEGWRAVRVRLHSECMAAAVECGAARRAREDCPRWQRCYELRRDIETAIVAVENLAAELLGAAQGDQREMAEQLSGSLSRARVALAELLSRAPKGDGP